MMLNDLDMPLPSIRELANKVDTPMSLEIEGSHPEMGKIKPKINLNTHGFRLGIPSTKVFTSNKDLYSKTGSLLTPVKPGLYTLPIRAHDYRVKIWDYTLEEIKNRDFSRQVVKRKRKNSDEERLSDFKLGDALG